MESDRVNFPCDICWIQVFVAIFQAFEYDYVDAPQKIWIWIMAIHVIKLLFIPVSLLLSPNTPVTIKPSIIHITKSHLRRRTINLRTKIALAVITDIAHLVVSQEPQKPVNILVRP